MFTEGRFLRRYNRDGKDLVYLSVWTKYLDGQIPSGLFSWKGKALIFFGAELSAANVCQALSLCGSQ